MNEDREIIKEYTLPQIARWAAGPQSFTLDFGDYEKDYLILVTDEGAAISEGLTAYVEQVLSIRQPPAATLGSVTSPSPPTLKSSDQTLNLSSSLNSSQQSEENFKFKVWLLWFS